MRKDMLFRSLLIGVLLAWSSENLFAFQETVQTGVYVNAQQTLDALIGDEDTDSDKRITINDAHVLGTDKGDKRFWIGSPAHGGFEVVGTYYLSNLLQELKLAQDKSLDTTQLTSARVFEKPVHRISRMIRELFWDDLTRHIDEEGLVAILKDEKTVTVDGYHYIYVPATDNEAYKYFSDVAARHPSWKMKVVRLPEKITADHVRKLDGRHGILSLALERGKDGRLHGKPFAVPGGRFNEMYGWDSYFIVLGLLHDGRVELARSMVDNFVYQIMHYGAILNANRTYYLTRSQPPFFTSMALAVYDHLPATEASKDWLRVAIEAAVKEYHDVWMSPQRLTAVGLSRYHDSGYGQPPEVEPGHFDFIYRTYAMKLGISPEELEKAYTAGKLRAPELDQYFIHDRAMRESGHDTSYRLVGRAANLVTVDLNSLLFKFEMDIGRTLETEYNGSLSLSSGKKTTSEEWKARAEKRKELMNRYLWNEEQGMFFDYDFVEKKQTGYVSAATFYPLWAGVASSEQAGQVVRNGLPLLEVRGGIVGSTEKSRSTITLDRPLRQWDYPYGWAPHQMLVWDGLRQYEYTSIAQRLAYRWLYTITLNAVQFNGTVPEKFDVVRRTHQVFAEYGNVGTKFSYITREGFGWTNTSYQLGCAILPEELQDQLNRLIPPEWVFLD
jgi:alpha,alpha-trehalase